MKEYDTIVIGGGPAGIVSAVTARKYYHNSCSKCFAKIKIKKIKI